MRQTRIQIARPDIIRFFESSSQVTYRYGEISAILAANRTFWRLTRSMTTDAFLEYILKSTPMRRLEVPFSARKEIRYVWGDVPMLEVLLSLHGGSYFSHYAAVRFHGLTQQLPKSLYLNIEQKQIAPNGSLSQKGIDLAFRGKPRISNNVAVIQDFRVIQIHGKGSGMLGVQEMKVHDLFTSLPATIQVTSIERTLIDIAVRPAYSGGVHEVMSAYKYAVGKVSVNRLVAMLQRLDFTYPYHQVLGFYLDKTGSYSANQLNLLKRKPQEFDFYLSHHIESPVYVEEWRLWVPKGMELQA